MIATAKSVREEMQVALRDIAGFRSADDSVGALIRRASRACANIPYSQIYKLWYGNANLVRAEYADEIRAARREALRKKIAIQRAEIEIMQRKIDEWT